MGEGSISDLSDGLFSMPLSDQVHVGVPVGSPIHANVAPAQAAA